MTVEVTIKNARNQAGHLLYEVSPVAGNGTTWVRASSVVLAEPEVR